MRIRGSVNHASRNKIGNNNLLCAKEEASSDKNLPFGFRMRREERGQVPGGRRRGGATRPLALDGRDLPARLAAHGVLVRGLADRQPAHTHRGPLYPRSAAATVSFDLIAFLVYVVGVVFL